MKTFQLVTVALATGLALASAPAGAATAGHAGQEEKNKQLVLTAYQGLFGDHDLSVIGTPCRPSPRTPPTRAPCIDAWAKASA